MATRSFNLLGVSQEVSDSVRPAVGEMVPDSVLEVDGAAGLCKESSHAGMTEFVPVGWRRHGQGGVGLVT